MAIYLWTLCNMWHVCWIMYDLGCMMAINRDPSWYSLDYRVYMGSSMIVWLLRRLQLYLCSYKLDGSVIAGIRARFNIIAICVFKTKVFVLQKLITNFPHFLCQINGKNFYLTLACQFFNMINFGPKPIRSVE